MLIPSFTTEPSLRNAPHVVVLKTSRQGALRYGEDLRLAAVGEVSDPVFPTDLLVPTDHGWALVGAGNEVNGVAVQAGAYSETVLTADDYDDSKARAALASTLLKEFVEEIDAGILRDLS